MIRIPGTDYLRYKSVFHGCRFPLAFVDLDHFDRNIAYVADTCKGTGKTIRVASKSIRSPALLRRVFEKGGDVFQGILAFTMEEAEFLIENGFDDIIVAYPSIQPPDVKIFTENTRQGARLSLMADSFDHLTALSRAGVAAGVILNICLDVDMSYRPLGSRLHLGVRRSPLRSVKDVLALALAAKDLPGIRIVSLMGYEAQVASVNDDLPGHAVKNTLTRWFKKNSARELAKRRGEIVRALADAGITLEVVNGGGSGSLISTARDPSVTEVTAGSAFFAPGLFHYFHQVTFQPAAFFGLQVVRRPAPGIVTCQGGGYTASGEAGPSRLPWPVLPRGLKYIGMEGAGEVQTPLVLPKDAPVLEAGDPVFFQHAKAGELCERFNRLYLVKGKKIADEVPTYRGEGHAFL
ncbi:MAG: alanine racemase [Desulfotignum sp.]|nr:alanine racemase [Desulfotignum sp.]